MEWSNWIFWTLPAAGVVIAVLEADGVLIGQWMLSRPVVTGTVVGALLGQSSVGFMIGMVVELVCLEEIPVGSVVPLNGAVAAGCSVLMLSGPTATPGPIAVPAGLACGAVFSRIETRLRKRRASLSARAAEALSSDGEIRWRGLFIRVFGEQMASTAAFVFVSTLVLGVLASAVWEFLPVAGARALEFGFRAAPWLGAAALIRSVARKR